MADGHESQSDHADDYSGLLYSERYCCQIFNHLLQIGGSMSDSARFRWIVGALVLILMINAGILLNIRQKMATLHEEVATAQQSLQQYIGVRNMESSQSVLKQTAILRREVKQIKDGVLNLEAHGYGYTKLTGRVACVDEDGNSVSLHSTSSLVIALEKEMSELRLVHEWTVPLDHMGNFALSIPPGEYSDFMIRGFNIFLKPEGFVLGKIPESSVTRMDRSVVKAGDVVEWQPVVIPVSRVTQ